MFARRVCLFCHGELRPALNAAGCGGVCCRAVNGCQFLDEMHVQQVCAVLMHKHSIHCVWWIQGIGILASSIECSVGGECVLNSAAVQWAVAVKRAVKLG